MENHSFYGRASFSQMTTIFTQNAKAIKSQLSWPLTMHSNTCVNYPTKTWKLNYKVSKHTQSYRSSMFLRATKSLCSRFSTKNTTIFIMTTDHQQQKLTAVMSSTLNNKKNSY